MSLKVLSPVSIFDHLFTFLTLHFKSENLCFFVCDTVAPPLHFDPHEINKVYDTVPRTDDVFNLNRRDVVLTRELGGGNFGSVMLGEYRHRNKTVPVAIKMLKQADVPTAEASLTSLSCYRYRP